MNIGWNTETIVTLIMDTLSIAISIYILRFNWRRYGLLFLLSAAVGNILCYLFLILKFYYYPYRLFPSLSGMPLTEILTVFPMYVLLSVRYSPKAWGWKIPYYWALVHLGMAAETWAQEKTQLIKYGYGWNVWTSYTWWWIFLLLFEWLGGLIVPAQDRRPIHPDQLKFATLGWFILHFILIATIFLAGYLLGSLHPYPF